MKNYLISVIVPVYNVEQYIGQTIESILGQTYTNFELLLIDDGSTDNSGNICAGFSSDERVKVYHQENQGVSSARNLGIKYSSGEYLCFVDADDLVEHDFLQCMISKADEIDCEFIYSGYKFLYQTKTVEKVAFLTEGEYLIKDIMGDVIDDGTLSGIMFGSVCGCLYDSAIIKNNNVLFNEEIKRNEDGIFNLRIIRYLDSFYYYDIKKYLYRQWKSEKYDEEFKWDIELERATSYIIGEFKDFPKFDQQIKRRYVSVVFWNFLRICQIRKSQREVVEYLKTKLERDFFENIQYLDYSNMNNYKRFLIGLLAKNDIHLFVFMIRKIKPILEKILNH